MMELVTTMTTAIATFTATNLDDIFILTLFFAQVGTFFRRRHIVVGQYLGFILLVLISLSGFWGSFFIPDYLIRGLGLIPLLIGLKELNKAETAETSEPNSLEEMLSETDDSHWLNQWLSPQVYSVATVTVANGSDNISVYFPLFASSTAQNLSITLITFLCLVGVWCVVAYYLTHLPAIAVLLNRYGNTLVPCILIGLGVYIVKENLSLAAVAILISYLWTISLHSPPINSKP